MPNVFSRWFTSLRSNGWFGPYGLQDKVLLDLFGGKPASSGVPVDETKSLSSTVVWACVNLIAGTIATLPLIHYRKFADDSREEFNDSRLSRLFRDANDEMPWSTFLESVALGLLLWGNGFAEIVRDKTGQVAALWPIEPWRVQAVRNGRSLRYRIDGSVELSPDEMLHVPGLTPDGIWGYSPIQKMREALGLLLAAEKFGGTFFGQGSNFGGILTHPGKLSEAAEKNLRHSLEQRAQGVERAHNFIVLQEGLRYDKIGIPPNDAQFLETRQFQIGEIARIFGVPPHMIGDTERSTSWGTGIEQQAIGFVKFSLRRWLVRIEDEIMRKLISPLERNLQYVEFLTTGLERGDFKTRVDAYVALKQAGLTTANRVAKLENWEPFGEEGDILFVPSNMVPADRVNEVVDKQVAPTPPPAAPAPPPPEPAPARMLQLEELREDIETLLQLGRETVDRQSRIPLPLDTTALVERTVDQIKALPPPPPVDLAPLMARLDALDLEGQTHEGQVGALQHAIAELVPQLTNALPPPVPPAPPTDLSPVLERLEALEVERRAQAARVAAILPGMQLLIEDAARDFVRREVDRVRRAAVAPDKLAAWIDEFYPRQEDYAVKVLRGAMQVYTQLVGRPDDAERDIRATIALHVTESRDALFATLQTPPEALKSAVMHLSERWEAERPAVLARALMAGGLVLPVPRSSARDEDDEPPETPPAAEPQIVDIIEKEVLERDSAGRAQKIRDTRMSPRPPAPPPPPPELLVTEVVEKEVLERDASGRAQKVRETHTRKK